ncbi:meiotic recombination protein SPO11, putative [Plasmodium knowlesi strain H]|uniref:DNA topoisomerase (ATP-hydrolyzing) n=3 Tax=Plasmodium knowlesi TaxID=5850 RepID=A0A1A7VG05_PLAKH|nr:meiotic recombination protein SPO11, putative [Plasmodium knowlesi strain H]OTN64157.1 putative Meiotic recombination protein SPO11 [Plasmodium knowlesi]CAA9990963.1 meiotic recombination protein SPO11, putative [Plasmodium knowlesi strain H]SBO20804.1 meiotic recombination protein SPO11, putative [Plasmodium knowlesi strain H]SBO21236.1 meiotic recombination protein SPO11, putative [Plasmodium knowlesi strain H]VVS80437.1 meiotic recombination protein SPO11, putative [Plasmodium knowlesi s
MRGNVDVTSLLEKCTLNFLTSLLDKKKKKKVLSKGKILEMARLFCIIEIVSKNLKTNTHSTLRQIFYTNPHLFMSQNVSNVAIGKLTKIIKIPRELLNIYNSPKGIIRGNIFLREKKSSPWVDCMSIFETRGHLICPFGISDIKISPDVKYVLIVEKETIFFRLLQSDFISNYGPCILITARGFPDINTRQLLYEIRRYNKGLKVFCITDYDAYGLSIAFTYTSKMESKVYYVEDVSIDNLFWLNLFSPEEGLQKHVLKDIDISKLTLRDIRMLDNICETVKSSRKFCSSEIIAWTEHANHMKTSGMKYEVDAIQDIEKYLSIRIEELL